MNLKKRQYPPEFVSRQPILEGKYRILFPLGEGRYSKYNHHYTARVKMGIDISTGQKVAIKIFKTKAPFQNHLISSFLNQVNTLAQTSHRHIVRVIDFKIGGIQAKSDGSVKRVMFYVMKLGQNGQMFRLIHETEGFTEKMARFYFRQIIQALHYLHKEGIAHRDVKTENIIIDKDYNIKLADFGFSCRYIGNNKKKIPMNTDIMVGTPKTSAPEIMNPKTFKEYYANDLDLFAAGCILFEICMKCLPFKSASMDDEHYRKLNEDQKSFWKIFSNVYQPSSEFKDLISGLLKVDKSERYSLEELMNHPWYLGQMPTQQELQKQMSIRFKKLNNIIKQERQTYIKLKLSKKGRKVTPEGFPYEAPLQFGIDKEFEEQVLKLTKFFQQRDDSGSDKSSNSDNKQSRLQCEKEY